MMDLANAAIIWCRSPEYRDLTTRQLAVLALISASPTRVKDLAAAIGVQKPVITRAVDRLACAGLARRTRGADRRDCIVTATESGHRLRNAIGGIR